MTIVVQFDLKLEQMNVKTVFLHGEMEEKTYINNLKVIFKNVKKKVCLLKKFLYGLKQSPRQ